jgi:hypothetical protein
MDITPPNGKWRRPMIWDITPPNYGRPTAEQADAGHRVVKKRWQRQAKRRAEETPSAPEDVRLAHLRWRELIRLLRHRYGVVMPDTDAARRDLELLLNYAVLTGKKVQHQVDLWAPWLDEDEADHIAAHQRAVLHRADDLARRLDLKYCDRQVLAITTIGSVDVDQAERERLRCQRRNEAKQQKRAAKQQQEKAVQTYTADNLPPKEQKVLARIDGAEIAVPDLIRRVANLKEFKKLASPRWKVHQIVDRLVAAGLVTDRYAPGPKGMPVRHVSRRQQPSRF